MILRALSCLFAFCISFDAWAFSQIKVAVGPSVPEAKGNFILPSGPTRASGGERFVFKFASPKTITTLRISAFSKTRKGKALVQDAFGKMGIQKISLGSLFQFGQVTSGNPTNWNGKNMLTDSSFVEANLGQTFTEVQITVEGFTHDDSSILFQISSAEDFVFEDFLITRSGPRQQEFVGGLIDLARYGKFGADELQRLMSQAKLPDAADLAGKSFVCTSYSRLNPLQLDGKQRFFTLTTGGQLQSESELEGPTQTWSPTPQGLLRTIEKYNGCGKYLSYQILRVIGDSLISEVVIELENYVSLCVRAGYDESAVRAVEEKTTYPSRVSAKFVAGSYEFCRLQ